MFELGARAHAFLYGLFRKSDKDETRRLYGQVERLAVRHGVETPEGRDALARSIGTHIGSTLELSEELTALVKDLIARLINYEELFYLPEMKWHEQRTISEYWDLKDSLRRQRQLLEGFDEVVDQLALVGATGIGARQERLPPTAREGNESAGISISTEIVDVLSDVGSMIEEISAGLFQDEPEKVSVFPRLQRRLEANLVEASGGNPADPNSFRRALKMPSQSDMRDRRELVSLYLGGTPLTELFSGRAVFTIPESSRHEHHHIVAGSGHGKTQTLQYLIANDLEAVTREQRSVIIIDSQGDLISNIAKLKCFAPGQALHDRLCLIDPTDIEYPVSLNMFDVGQDRLSGYAPLERERLTNSILELYDFVLGSLLSAGMTQKQEVIFRYVTRLMLHIPDATIHTLRELMEPNAEVKFAAHIAKLEGSAAHFFNTEFNSSEFRKTKEQVLRRLWGILENQTFERMFSHPRSKLDLFSEMNASKVVLINTSKDLLKASGTEIFGRFFIALIAQAAQERAVLPNHQRLSTIVYIDEAADYFDRNIETILAQARKYNVGMVLAHQYLGQLDPKLQEAFSANTAIKFAGGVSARDARSLAPMMYCEPGFIEEQPKLSFAASIRGVTKSAVPLAFPAGHLERLPKMSNEERKTLQEKMRLRYAVHYSELNADKLEEPSEELDPDDKHDPSDKTGPDGDSEPTDISPTPNW